MPQRHFKQPHGPTHYVAPHNSAYVEIRYYWAKSLTPPVAGWQVDAQSFDDVAEGQQIHDLIKWALETYSPYSTDDVGTQVQGGPSGLLLHNRPNKNAFQIDQLAPIAMMLSIRIFWKSSSDVDTATYIGTVFQLPGGRHTWHWKLVGDLHAPQV